MPKFESRKPRSVTLRANSSRLHMILIVILIVILHQQDSRFDAYADRLVDFYLDRDTSPLECEHAEMFPS